MCPCPPGERSWQERWSAAPPRWAAGCESAGAAPSPSGTDPSVVAAINAGRTPTRWGTSLPGIATAFNAAGRQLALTFDACDRGCDEALLNALQTKNVPAALFICSKWIDGNPGRIDQLAANPLFEIGNHGTRHVPLSMTGRSAYGIAGTKSAAEVVDEVMTNQNRITALPAVLPRGFGPARRTTTTTPCRWCTNSASPRSVSLSMPTTVQRHRAPLSAPRWPGPRRVRSCWRT